MKFPFWYTGEMVFYKSDQINVAEAIDNIVCNNDGKILENKQILFQGNKGLFGWPSRIKLHLNSEGTTIHITYHLSLFESNILLLFGILFGSFFYMYNHVNYSVLAIIISCSLYIINTFKLSAFAKELVAKFGSLTKSIEQQKLWEQQQKWIKDIKVCPACGEPVNPYSANCVNCGLFFKGKKSKNHDTGVNNTNNQEISIEYKGHRK